MCMICEMQLFEEHQILETLRTGKTCPRCHRFPAGATGGVCYHCFSLGNVVEQCPACAGLPWSDAFKETQREVLRMTA